MSVGISTSTSLTGMKTNIESFKTIYTMLKTVDEKKPAIKTISDCIIYSKTLDFIHTQIEDIAQAQGWMNGFNFIQYPNGQKKYNMKHRNIECCILIALQISHSKLKTGKSKYTKDVQFFLDELSELAEKLLDTDTHKWTFDKDTNTVLVDCDKSNNKVKTDDAFYLNTNNLIMYAYNTIKLYDSMCTQARQTMIELTTKV